MTQRVHAPDRNLKGETSGAQVRNEEVSTSALQVRGNPACQGIWTPEAKAFVGELVESFGARIEQLLSARTRRKHGLAAGDETLDFLAETAKVRSGDWVARDLPVDLLDRRVEITGPVNRKMIINALNSGAQVFMADFEDSTAPTWRNLMDGQQNLMDAVRGSISLETPTKSYRLKANPAVLFVRPRGLHLPEAHVIVNGKPAAAALVDFGLFFFHNVRALLDRGTGAYFYLPKLESHKEARLWNDVFVFAEDKLGVSRGTIRATVLIETLPAAFEMDEIIYELRDHIVGLNCGRWDYIFSFIKTLGHDAAFVLPDRAQVTMNKAFLRAYSRLLIATCHRRKVHAMGGMAAQIPIKNDAQKNELALAKVRADKLREVEDGHDGTWVAHPALVSLAREVFDENMPAANQIETAPGDASVTKEQLIEVHEGTQTEQGVRTNTRVALQYIAAWLGGNGCVPIANLMEDAATAEISRAQLWQWAKHGVRLDSGTVASPALIKATISEELETLLGPIADDATRENYKRAAVLFEDMATRDDCVDFLTLPAYQQLLQGETK